MDHTRAGNKPSQYLKFYIRDGRLLESRLPCVNARLAYCVNSVLNVRALVLVGAFIEKKALVEAFFSSSP